MRTSFTILALLSAFAAAVPASSSYGSSSTSPTYGSGSGSGTGSSSGSSPVEGPDLKNDGGCTLYKAQKLVGKSSPTDYTPIPADAGCVNLNSLYGLWENQTRSLVVQKDYKCDFYTEYECPTTNTPLCLKASGQKIIKKTLPKGYDRKIKSVKCNKIKVEKPKPKPKPKPTPSPAPKPYSPPSSY
ncbi:hypothetical protein GRF29_185g572539 [Pseudopithomyces chartarum]|uniref:Secreted protein n=1 Tax=Pseudopithomyces chartarum TaxID=1892770 RepID=A0AAN6LNI2_9PLEO|nr:hypothetical protein GRF29_185g572539 [Pseudopithomyces chartarum]